MHNLKVIDFLRGKTYICGTKLYRFYMEKKIRWIFTLTVIATCSVILMQAFWLRSQYIYGMEQLLKDHADRVFLKAESFWEYKGKTINQNVGFMVSVRGKGSAWMTTVSAPEAVDINPRTAIATLKPHTQIKADSFDLHVPLPGQGLSSAVSKQLYLMKYSCSPYVLERFLRTSLRDSSLTVADAVDSLRVWQYKIWDKHFFFHPRFTLLYGFSPLVSRNVLISCDLDPKPVFGQLAWSFGGACLWAILMIFCLVYQARVLFDQYKIDSLRKDFSHTMIHELRRPVQTLKMLMAFLEDKRMRKDEQLYNATLANAREELDNLSAYFAKLRDMTYGDEKSIPLNKVSFDAGFLAGNAIRSLNVPVEKTLKAVLCINGKEVLQRTGTSILVSEEVLKTPAKPWLMMTADRIHMSNIFNNLLENAVKYSKPDAVDICVGLMSSSGEIIINVKDCGLGISAEDCRHVFDKFYRSHSHAKSGIPGIGLGLSYVKLLVEAHGGTVAVASHPGEWTEFTIHMPA